MAAFTNSSIAASNDAVGDTGIANPGHERWTVKKLKSLPFGRGTTSIMSHKFYSLPTFTRRVTMFTTKRRQAGYATAVAGLGALLLMGSQAKADVISFDLTSGNSAISGFTGPYAHVDVNRTTPTMATITFTSLTNSGNIYLLGDGGSVGVNVNATSFTLGAISGSNAGTGFTPGPYSDGGSGNQDGFGVFNQTINSFDGFTHSSDLISFNITDTSRTWATANDLLV